MQTKRWWDVGRRSRESIALFAERDRLANELRIAEERVAALTEGVGAGDERDRLARDIQDTIAQELTSLVLAVQRGRRELRSGNAPGAAKQFNILEENLRRSLKETRAMVASGAPVGVEGGLTIALDELGEAFERDTGISVTVRARGTASLDPNVEALLLGAAKVALSNVHIHSEATAASITVSTTHGTVVLRVADNGRGFDTSALAAGTLSEHAAERPAGGAGGDSTTATGHGLHALRDVLDLADGSLTVVSTVGNGTAVIASLPGFGPGAL
ncbi:histidine kinase/DNA gyrase B/HSP90-like ATPase [Glaciihabitans tibetensis]|uniref:Oxygen sensor histidine kinase NreB n=1 Tax=Glaciihabitans tibetensis TaxID=1266600 RepID=A0A2T0VA56_9MICO|nr:histidine kinase [Glaciihabitans tibetensis]PRY67075.1 histidine kinase/DNA gyrase B/HSP90-like ATPase [Glaciihabitans tibetensis]